MPNGKATIDQVLSVVNRVEDKMDDRLDSVESRLQKLEKSVNKFLGGLAVIQIVIGGAVAWLWKKVGASQ